ncbi:MAG: Undecaprenyl-phosphate galactosephosphotransferase [Parcubacteria group bacterium GW2011_GWA2_47_10b]|nr:MAG: Undecaprenyl-phosphate galactosephosphotransferase [Parcubacteria group bacterium GW2011_GWA2_47_10b]KKU86427.1 MAG: Undecaprenyl-phosphate galactosephosphotransferase [Parcubacteria group bacterium GW2011_GWA1_47_9]
MSVLLFTDVVSIFTAFVGAYYFRQSLPLAPIQQFGFYGVFLAAATALFIAIFTYFNLYKKTRSQFSISYFIDFLKAFSLWGVFLVAFSYFTKSEYSRFVVVLFFVISVVLVYASRLFVAWMTGQKIPRNGDAEIVREIKTVVREKADLAAEYKPQRPYYFAKRVFDFLAALVLSVMVAPAVFVVIFLIRRDSKGRAIIVQERVGMEGELFYMYKFRTMAADTELYAPAPQNNKDSRITKIGRFLRNYSIDELPQFWNVLKGEMSIVGPRPEMAFIVEKYEPWQKIRLQVKPGITGFWQVIGRKDLPLEENIEYDIYYVLHQSFFLDLAIMLKTIPRLFFSYGAY